MLKAIRKLGTQHSALLYDWSQNFGAGSGASSLSSYLPLCGLHWCSVFLNRHQWHMPYASYWYCWFHPSNWQGQMLQFYHHEFIWLLQTLTHWYCLILPACYAFELETPGARYIAFCRSRVVAVPAMFDWFKAGFTIHTWSTTLCITLSIPITTYQHRVIRI